MKYTIILLLIAIVFSAQSLAQEEKIVVPLPEKVMKENLNDLQNLNIDDQEKAIRFLITSTKDIRLKNMLENLIEDFQNLKEDKLPRSRVLKTETLLEDDFLISEEIYQDWNGTAWVNTYRYTYLYDAKNNMVQQTSQNWTTSWQNNYRSSSTYDANNNQTERIGQSWNGTTWVNSNRTTYAWNSNNYLTEIIYYSWSGTAWTNTDRYAIQYDANNNQTEELSQTWSGAAWVNNYRNIMVYDINDNLIEATYQTWISSAWRNDSKYLYTYDSNNNRTQYLYQTWSGTAWINDSKSTFTYDVNNNLIESIYQSWNVTLWVNESKYNMSYDISENLIEQVYQRWDTLSVIWKNYSRYQYTYDVSGNNTGYLYQRWNTSAWENNSKTSYTYNANNDLLEYLYQIWNVTVWENNYKYTNTYDSNFNLIQRISQNWSGTAWVNESQFIATYVPATNITLISPNGGESWQTGSSKDITWTSSNISSIKIQYSTNNGTSWINIGNVTAGLGSFSWTVPNTLSTNCKVMISDVSNALVFDESDTVFTISAILNPQVSLTSPNGGENWLVGSVHPITWTSNDVDSVSLSFTTDNGVTKNSIILTTPSDGSYDWTIPNSPSANCKILIANKADTSVKDQSDAVFTISAPVTPVITVTSPNGGEDWIVGASQSITWTSTAVDSVKIEYSTNNGTNWNVVIASTPSNGSYSWTVPNTPSSNCKVRISDVLNSSTMDTCNTVFSIFAYPSTFTVTANYTFEDATKTTSYQIIGLPGANNLALGTVMTGTPGASNDWRAFWDTGAGNYTEYDATGTFNFTPGKAFWVVSKNPITISKNVDAVTLAADFSYSIPVHVGWNLISNPFNKNILWSSIKTANGDTIQPIHFFQNGSYSNPTGFEPYKGYYFLSNGLTSLKIPYLTELTKQNHFDSREVDIVLLSNGIRKSEVHAGVYEDARDGVDIFDIFSPPSQFSEINITLFNEELEANYKYLQNEYRLEIGEGQEFNFIVKNISAEPIDLAVDGKDDFAEYEIFLFDKSLKRLYDLKKENPFQIKAGTTNKEYSLFIGTASYIEMMKSELLPTEFMLYQNYPNPFNPSTRIMFAMPQQGMVTLRVYNILGEMISELVNNQFYEAGYHEVNFDGRGNASGIYIYELHTTSSGNQSFTDIKKMILLK